MVTPKNIKTLAKVFHHHIHAGSSNFLYHNSGTLTSVCEVVKVKHANHYPMAEDVIKCVRALQSEPSFHVIPI